MAGCDGNGVVVGWNWSGGVVWWVGGWVKFGWGGGVGWGGVEVGGEGGGGGLGGYQTMGLT